MGTLPLCPCCHRGYFWGATSCEGCGHPLESIRAESHDMSSWVELEPHGPAPVFALALRVEGNEPVKIQGQSARIVVIGSKPLLIGRRDPAGGVYPDIDLQGLRDYGYTSREHARVFIQGGVLYAEDLKGLGTTAVNDPATVLSAGAPYPLKPGDRLIVGEAVTFLVIEHEVDEPRDA